MAMIGISISSSRVDTSKERGGGSSYISSGERTGAYINKNATVADIKKEDGVVNVYLFWGNGCPHCKAEWEWIESVRDDYKDVNFYGLEVWYNSENREQLNVFAEAIGASDIDSVPFTVIGDQFISGYGDNSMFVKAIEKAKKSGADVYFDKILK